MSKYLLGNKESISVEKLLGMLDCVDEGKNQKPLFTVAIEGKIYEHSWFKDILIKIKRVLKNAEDPKVLEKLFEVISFSIYYL